MGNVNGMSVLGRRGNTIFMRLPVELRRPIDGGCRCPYCEAHPECVPLWDTLAVAQNGAAKGCNDVTWTCHMPDPRNAK